MEDFEDGEMEDEYDAIPAYEAPHKRKEDRKEQAWNTVAFSKTLKNRKSGPKLPKQSNEKMRNFIPLVRFCLSAFKMQEVFFLKFFIV